MTQPFRQVATNTILKMSNIELTYRIHDLLLTTATSYDCLSNAIWNGGITRAKHFLNWKVPLDFADENPENACKTHAVSSGLDTRQTVVLMTAAKLTHASVHQTKQSSFSILCLATAGTSNAVRAGKARKTYPSYVAGTVNVTVLINAKMTSAAIANALITSTEAKAAALIDAGIPDQSNGLLATGTTTDAVVIGCSQSNDWPHIHRYAGTASELGHAIEMLVYQSVLESVTTQHDD